MTPVPARVPAGPGPEPRPRPRPGPRPRSTSGSSTSSTSARSSGVSRDGAGLSGPARRLEVVGGGAVGAKSKAAADPAVTPARRPRAAVLIAAASICALMLALAAVHSLLVSNQVRLDALERQVTAEQARYASLRLEVAQLEAPERIVREAQQRMGMVAPETVTYLSPSGAVAAGAPAGDPVPQAGGERSWAAIKPYLGDR